MYFKHEDSVKSAQLRGIKIKPCIQIITHKYKYDKTNKSKMKKKKGKMKKKKKLI